MHALKAKKIITGDGKTVYDNCAVLLTDDGMIDSIIPQDKMENISDAQLTDYGNATILPGLIDMHVHIGFWLTRGERDLYRGNPSMIALLAADELKRALKKHGVTTLRGVAEPAGLSGALKIALDSGYIDGPRYISSFRGISCTGGHGVNEAAYVVEADGVDSVRRAVRQEIKDGADWIKVLTSHRRPGSQLTAAELNTAAEETHSWGKKCCVHAGTQEAIDLAIAAGFDTIEHGTFMTKQQAEEAAAKGIALVPTIYPYWNGYQRYSAMAAMTGLDMRDQLDLRENLPYFEKSAKQYEANFKILEATGIKIATGTDVIWPELPITPVGDEMKLMHKFGASILNAVKYATKNPAEILEIQDIAGEVAPGLQADLLVVEGDLTMDINCIDNIEAVYQKGKKM